MEIDEPATRTNQRWAGNALISSRLHPIKKVTRLMEDHRHKNLKPIKHRITDALSEALNRCFVAMNSAESGFRSCSD